MRRLHADLVLLLAALIWGLAFVFQKSAMQHVGPLAFVASRSAVAALCLLPLALIEHRRSAFAPDAILYRMALAAGLVFFIGAWVQQTGIVTATVTNTGFLTALYVVMTPLVVWAWSRNPPPLLVWPAVALSALGTWFLGGGSLAAFSRGDVLVAISAIFWSVHVVLSSRAAAFSRPLAFTATQFAVVAVLAAGGAFLLETPSWSALRAAAVDIAFVGVLSSALTFTLLIVALKHTPPSEAAIIMSTDTIFAAIGAYLLVGERLSVIGWAGAGLIVSATLLVQAGPLLRRIALKSGLGLRARER